jgi:GT2 family glycosyltransferase
MMDADNAINPSQVTVVTVTYGDRRHLLEPVLRAALAQEVGKIIVVNNGASWNINTLASGIGLNAVEVLDMGSNTGSARGCSAGIAQAMEAGAELIWLLDDDNKPTDGALSVLLAEYTRLRAKRAADQLAVLAFRPEQQAMVAMGGALNRINPRKSSFHGFHIFDVPYKIWRRMPWGKQRIKETLPRTLNLDVAPYGGLLFHRLVIDKISLPRADFVLYGDDTEFTYRITRNGGQIVLVTGAVIEDLESSWNAKQRFGNSFSALLCGSGDFRAYYSMRNCTFFDAHCLPHNRYMFWINRQIYMMTISIFSLIKGQADRHRLLVQAVNDGFTQHLGVNKEFPL